MTARSPSDTDTGDTPSAVVANAAATKTDGGREGTSPRARSSGRPDSGHDHKASSKSSRVGDATTDRESARSRKPRKATASRSANLQSDTAQTPTLDDDAVEAYLRAHPDFLARHLPLLDVLSVPHPIRGATSLIEAKLRYYRERDAHMRAQIQMVFRNAEANQKMVERLHALACRLLGTDTPEAALAVVLADLRDALGNDDRVEIRLFPDALETVAPGSNARLDATHRMPAAAFDNLRDIIDAGVVLCGRHRKTRLLAAFGDAAESIGSAVLAPLRVTHSGHSGNDARTSVGLLAIGAQDPERFRADMGTFLIEHLADLCAAAVVSRRASAGNNA